MLGAAMPRPSRKFAPTPLAYHQEVDLTIDKRRRFSKTSGRSPRSRAPNPPTASKASLPQMTNDSANSSPRGLKPADRIEGEIAGYRDVLDPIHQNHETLYLSSQGWHEAKHDVWPWTEYFPGTLLAAYSEFEARFDRVGSGRGSKTETVQQAPPVLHRGLQPLRSRKSLPPSTFKSTAPTAPPVPSPSPSTTPSCSAGWRIATFACPVIPRFPVIIFCSKPARPRCPCAILAASTAHM